MYDATDIAVFGESEFQLGFRLAGVRRFIEVKEGEDVAAKAAEALSDKKIGVLVMHKRHVDMLSEHMREKIEYSLSPVVVVLSEDAAGEEDLRRKIKRSIGVDVWDKK